MSTLELIRQRMLHGKPVPVCELLGMTLEDVTPGRAVVSMQAAYRHANPMGTLHGGILCDLADMAMGMAFMATVEEGQALATIELKMNYFRPVTEAKLTAVAQVTHRGRTSGFIECEIHDERGRLIAKSSSTCLVIQDDRTGRMAAEFAIPEAE